MRLDEYLVLNNLVETRSKAKDLINNNLVKVDNKVISKASYKVKDETITIIESKQYYARSAFKLLDMLEKKPDILENKVVLDIGASTGGFSQVALEYNASLVYALDVGTMQLHEDLFSNDKIVSLENTNILDVDKNTFDKNIDIMLIDVSFISLTKIIGHLATNFDTDDIICLIKPQFELDKKYLSKNNLVKDPNHHQVAINSVVQSFNDNGYFLNTIIKCSMTGRSGNQEYICLFSKNNKVNTNFKIKR